MKNRLRIIVPVLVVLGLLAGVAGATNSGVTVTPQASGDLGNGRTLIVAEINIEPGGYVDWHTHPGLTLGAVKQGQLTIVTTGCRNLEYPTGTAFTAPSAAHTARNFGNETASVLVTFRVKGTTPTILVDADRDARLDARCGFAD